MNKFKLPGKLYRCRCVRGHQEINQMQTHNCNTERLTHNSDTYYFTYLPAHVNGALLQKGDIMVVDRSVAPQNGKIVLAEMDGQLLVRMYERIQNKLFLKPVVNGLATMEINNGSDSCIWGVVTRLVRNL